MALVDVRLQRGRSVCFVASHFAIPQRWAESTSASYARRRLLITQFFVGLTQHRHAVLRRLRVNEKVRRKAVDYCKIGINGFFGKVESSAT